MGILKNKEFILWDNDGVLVETEYWFFEANRLALGQLSIDMNIDDYMLIMRGGKSSFVLAEQAGISSSLIESARKERSRLYRNFLLTKNLDIPGVLETLTTLREQFKMAIVTTSRGDDFRTIHENRPFTNFMEFILTLEDYPRAKPFPDPYLKGLELFNARPEQAVVIEDSERGLKSALAAGIDCIIVRNEFTKTHDFTGASLIVDHITDLPRVLQ